MIKLNRALKSTLKTMKERIRTRRKPWRHVCNSNTNNNACASLLSYYFFALAHLLVRSRLFITLMVKSFIHLTYRLRLDRRRVVFKATATRRRVAAVSSKSAIRVSLFYYITANSQDCCQLNYRNFFPAGGGGAGAASGNRRESMRCEVRLEEGDFFVR